MMPLSKRQGQFAEALLDPDLPTPVGLVGPDGRVSTKRFAVYRNNVVAGLVAILSDAFPATRRIVGAEFFAAMARLYVAKYPPISPILLDYGTGFPSFIGAFPPVVLLPYLSDVARIEHAWASAYHAPEATPISLLAFDVIPLHELPGVRLHLHPSVRLVRSKFPALTIWRMNIAGGIPEALDADAGPEDILISRPHADVEMRSLLPGSATFIHAVSEGGSLLEAMIAAIAADERFELEHVLQELFEGQLVIGFRPASDEVIEEMATLA